MAIVAIAVNNAVPAGGTVYAGVDQPPGWGAEAATGTYASGVWTPAHDVNGKVNAASWAIVPAETWVQVAGTVYADLDAAVKAVDPTWFEPRNWPRAASAYNGLCADYGGSRLWAVCWGGHDDGANNGIYEFNCWKMAWRIEHMPSNPNEWSSDYRNNTSVTVPQYGTYTICGETNIAAVAAINAETLSPINDIYEDELFWDNKPTSRHVYNGNVYKSDTNEIIMTTGRLWRYSLTTSHWTYRRVYDDFLAVQVANPARIERSMTRENVMALLDTTSNLIHVAATPLSKKASYDLNANTWLPDVSMPGGGNSLAVAAWRPDNKTAVFVHPHSVSPNGQYWLWDNHTNETLETGTIDLLGDLVPEMFLSTLQEGSMEDGAIYISQINRYWIRAKVRPAITDPATPAEWTILEVNPTVTPWTLERKVFANGAPVMEVSNAMRDNCMQYMPELNAVVLMASGGLPILVYKLGA